MENRPESAILDKMLEPVARCFTPAVAKQIAELRADPTIQTRVGNCCAYCLLEQEHLPFATFQVEHIIPRKHGGADDPSHPALACNRCNAHKGSNLTGIDPETGAIVRLFNP